MRALGRSSKDDKMMNFTQRQYTKTFWFNHGEGFFSTDQVARKWQAKHNQSRQFWTKRKTHIFQKLTVFEKN